MPDKNVIQRNLDAEVSKTALETNVQAHAAAALTAYDPPTKAELDTAQAAIIAEVNANETKIDAVKVDTAAIAIDVAGLNGEAMRGTDNAATAAALVTHDNKLDVVTGYVSPKVVGRRQVLEVSVTSAANGGDLTLATVTTQPCVIESIIIHADSAAQTDLTSAAVTGGAAKVVTFINAIDAAKVNIDAVDEQVAWTGAVRLAATKTIIISLVGTGVTPVDLTVTISYYACINGGYLT